MNFNFLRLAKEHPSPIFTGWTKVAFNIFAVTLLWISITILSTSFTHAQTYTIKGRIINSFKNESIPGATVTANKVKDSTRVAATIADAEGIFELEQIPVKDTLFMEVHSIGFKTFRAKIYFRGQAANMDSVFLMEDVTELEAVEVQGEHPAVVTRGDTVEYRAASYQTRRYAEANELLNKLPGLARDQNGNLTFNGRKISKILVDGREYFGTDGQMALNTIPVDVVEKIQLMNDTENKLSGKDASEEKVLNIQLKEDAQKFGNVLGGGGTSGRYEAMGMLNVMKDKSRLTFLGLGNNLNIAQYNQQTNAMSMTTSGNGIIETWGGGANYNDILGKNTALNSSVDFNFPKSINESVKSRTQFLVPDSSFFTETNSRTRNSSRNLNINTTVTQQKSAHDNLHLSIQGLTWSDGNGETSNSTRTNGEEGSPINKFENILRENTSRVNVPLSINWNKRFENNITTSVRLFSGWSRDKSNNYNQGSTIFYKDGVQDSVAQLNQQINKSNTTGVYGVHTDFLIPLIKKISMTISNGFRINRADNITDTWKINESREKLELDTLYSNSFRSLIVSDNFTYTLNYEGKKLGIYAGVSANYNNLRQDDLTRDQDLNQETLIWSPNIRIQYRFPHNGQVDFSYTARTSPPSPRQLQPLADNTNPLFVQQGNTDLRSTLRQSYNLNFSKTSPEGASTFYGSLSCNPVSNMIINTVIVDKNGRQISSYMNVDGVISISSSLGYSIRRKQDKNTLQINMDVSMNYAQNKNFVNDRLAASRTLNASPNVRINYDRQGLLTVSAMYAPTITKVNYNYASGQNQQFAIHNIQGTMDLYPLKNLTWRNFIGITYNGSLPEDFTKTIFFWNMELSYLTLKNKRGEFKLKVYDLLRQNKNLSRTVSQNYIESAQSNNLQQYIMLTFKYHIR